jgi:hypothetical protein
MVQDSAKVTYELVPPYDSLDVELGTQTNNDANAIENNIKSIQPQGYPMGPDLKLLRQREYCRWAFAFFASTLVTAILIVVIVTH